MIERTVYQCEHCKKFKEKPRFYFNKELTYRHESKCLYNEKNRTCLTCKHNNYDRYDNEVGRKVNDCMLGVEKEFRGTTLYQDQIGINARCNDWENKHDG